MRALLFIVPLLLAMGAGYGTGRLGKKRAIAKQYLQNQEVLREARLLLTVDPMAHPNVYGAQSAITQAAIDKYELEVRQL